MAGSPLRMCAPCSYVIAFAAVLFFRAALRWWDENWTNMERMELFLKCYTYVRVHAAGKKKRARSERFV